MKILSFNYSMLGYILPITSLLPNVCKRNFWPTHIFKSTIQTDDLLSIALHQGMGYPIFYALRGMDVKIRGVPWLWFFPGVSVSRYIFPKGKFEEFTFFEVADSKMISGIIFSRGIELSKIKFRGIYESNNYSFQSVLVFKNLVLQIPVWINHKVAQYFRQIYH